MVVNVIAFEYKLLICRFLKSSQNCHNDNQS